MGTRGRLTATEVQGRLSLTCCTAKRALIGGVVWKLFGSTWRGMRLMWSGAGKDGRNKDEEHVGAGTVATWPIPCAPIPVAGTQDQVHADSSSKVHPLCCLRCG